MTAGKLDYRRKPPLARSINRDDAIGRAIVGLWMPGPGGGGNRRLDDLSGHGNHVPITNGPTFAPIQTGNVGMLSGGTSDVGAVLTTPKANLKIADSLTAVWFGTKMTGGGNQNGQKLLSMGFNAADSTPFVGYSIGMDDSAGDNVRFEFNTASTYRSIAVTGTLATKNVPLMLALTFRNGAQFVYANGKQIGSATHAGTISYNSDAPFSINRHFKDQVSGKGSFAACDLAIVLDRALNPQEILRLWVAPYSFLMPLRRRSFSAPAVATRTDRFMPFFSVA